MTHPPIEPVFLAGRGRTQPCLLRPHPHTHTTMTPPSSSPAVAAQRRVLEAILATGCASPALAAAAEKGGDPFDALKSLPVVGYTDSYAAAARGCVDALRDGDVSAARAHLSHLLATVATSTTDASHVLAFFMTSGTSGNAAKLFPLTVAAQNARSSYYRVMAARSKATLAGVDGARLALATPGVPQELPCLVEGEEGVEVGGEVRKCLCVGCESEDRQRHPPPPAPPPPPSSRPTRSPPTTSPLRPLLPPTRPGRGARARPPRAPPWSAPPPPSCWGRCCSVWRRTRQQVVPPPPSMPTSWGPPPWPTRCAC